MADNDDVMVWQPAKAGDGRFHSLLQEIADGDFPNFHSQASHVTAHKKFVGTRSSNLERARKVCARKLLHDDDILNYNRTVPEFERMRLNPIAATNLTLIGGDKHGSQEKKGG